LPIQPAPYRCVTFTATFTADLFNRRYMATHIATPPGPLMPLLLPLPLRHDGAVTYRERALTRAHSRLLIARRASPYEMNPSSFQLFVKTYVSFEDSVVSSSMTSTMVSRNDNPHL
jgi:hypothetical protein